MKKRELSQGAMANVLVSFVQDKEGAIGVSKVAKKEAQDVVEAYALVGSRLGGASRQTKTVTKRRTGLKNTFVDTLAAVLGPARSYATKQGDTDLLALVTVGRKELRRLRPQALMGVGKKLVETCEGLATPLADYAVDAATLLTLRQAYDTYVESVPQTRIIINARTVDNLTASELLKALMQQIYELDAAMEIFALRDKELYAGYQKAREIVDVGATPADAGTTPPAG